MLEVQRRRVETSQARADLRAELDIILSKGRERKRDNVSEDQVEAFQRCRPSLIGDG